MKKITSTLWRRFEEVVSQAIKSILENITLGEIEEKLTEATHDGGYDGCFLIPCLIENDHTQKDGYYKVLFEAKLRADVKKDLPLQDFSKALIIAINMDSSALIIATNLRLSEGTQIHLKDFSEKTGLKTYYLSPYYINNWLIEHYSKKNEFADKKLQELLKNSSAYSDLKTPLVLLKKDTKSEKCELPKLLGTKKEKLLKTMSNALKMPNGIVLVKGDAGIGKTFFCAHLIANYQKDNYTVYIIDLKNYQTPRVLFLKILESLWHLPFDGLMSLDMSNFKAIIGECNQYVDKEIKEAVISAFSRDLEQYSQNADVLNYYMIKYLLMIHDIRTKHANIILYFSNINCLPEEMITFVYQFLNIYLKQGKAILELRTSTYIDAKMPSEEWESYVKDFSTMEDILYQDTIEKFSYGDACNFVRETLKLIKPDIRLIDAILRVTGNNPLFISSLVEYLNITKLVSSVPQEILIQRLEQLIFDDKRQIISMLIETFSKRNIFFAEFFEVIRIFQIPVKESYIKIILPEYQINYVEQLIHAGLVCRSNNNLEIVHPLQFECIINTYSLMDYARQNLARRILDTLNEAEYSADVFAMVQISCNKILRNYQKVLSIEYPLAMGLMESGQYTLCYKYVLDALENVRKIDFTCKTLIHLKILRLMIEICIYHEEDSVSEIDNYMEQLNMAVKNYQNDIEQKDEFVCFKVQYFMTKNRFEHYIGNFDTAFATLSEAIEFAECYKDILGNQVIGNIQLEYAIALKEKEDLEKSLGYLKKCLVKQPHNPELLFTYHTQMYEFNLLNNPKVALENTEKNRLLYPNLSKATAIHNEVHWLNTQFYLKNYDICFTKAISILKEVDKIGVKNEAGRLANLIGNIYFQKKELENAKIYYNYAIDLFQKKGYVSNIWSILINMSTLLVEINDEQATEFILSSIDILANSYRERIQRPYPLSGYYEKLQVAVIILYYNIQKYRHMLTSEKNEELLDYLSQKLLYPQFKDWLFSLSCEEIINILKTTRHYHSPYILLGN